MSARPPHPARAARDDRAHLARPLLPPRSMAVRPTAGLRCALVLAPAAVALALMLAPQPARSVILPAVPIDGPSPEIVGFGGVAMAEDGTGGLVYLERVAGVAHVFVSRYVEGRWLAPIRVDYAQPYAASWPRIGAADGGELVVVWATPYASENEQPVYRLESATLGPGASSFGSAQIVDRNIGRALGTSPDLAMSSTGQADVVYRVVKPQDERSAVPLLRPGDVAEEVRVARFRGEQWYPLGAVNHDPGLSMRPPTEANAPQIAVGPTGEGIVVWQEPEANGVARIWARRLFGATAGYSMEVSARTYKGAPIDEDADAPAVAFSSLGQAEVAYRQSAGSGSPGMGTPPTPRIYVNILPDGESASGTEFQGAVDADSSAPEGPDVSIGRPCIDIDAQRYVRLLYDSDGTPHVVAGTDRGLTPALALGPAFTGSALAPAAELPCVSVMNPAGGGISAWPSADAHGSPGVAVREDFPGGAVQTALVSGPAGGPIGQLAVGRSGLGDGLVAFEQGPVGDAAILAASVSAPPAPFLVNVPRGWVRPIGVSVHWQLSASAEGPLSYTVILDGQRLPTPPGVSSLALDPHWLGEGVHWVQVLATDADGQSTLTPVEELRIRDRPLAARRPRLRVAHRRPPATHRPRPRGVR
jgi:hypothetical protein